MVSGVAGSLAGHTTSMRGETDIMIESVEEIPVTEDSYPFESARRHAKLDEAGYVEREYYLSGTANVYRTSGDDGTVEVAHENAPYVNRIVVRRPEDPSRSSGNVIVEIINATSGADLNRMWILTHRQIVREGDVYVGVTSKPNTLAKLKEYDERRYGRLEWPNPTPDVPLDFSREDVLGTRGILDQDVSYEPGLFWDMLTDLAWLLRSSDEKNPLCDCAGEAIILTGWSQSGAYLYRYLASFAYRPEVARGAQVFDGYLAGGSISYFTAPVNQYETTRDVPRLHRVRRADQPLVVVQTESENARMGTAENYVEDSDRPGLLYRRYEVTGATHDTAYSLVDYYESDADVRRINCLWPYAGAREEGNDYPSWIALDAILKGLVRWVRDGVGPRSMDSRIVVGADLENVRDAFGNAVGGLRTCLLDYPTGRFRNDETDANGYMLFGYQESFSPDLLRELYGGLAEYRRLCEAHTAEQVSKGFVCKEDAAELVRIAVDLAERRGLR